MFLAPVPEARIEEHGDLLTRPGKIRMEFVDENKRKINIEE